MRSTIGPWRRSSAAKAGWNGSRRTARLAPHFPVVEVDATIYRSPSRRVAEGWCDYTPTGFGFSLKAPRPSLMRRFCRAVPAAGTAS